jgi:WD40 repeat protein
MLTIWSWKEERVILRSKAFSQEVFRVAFSGDSDGVLTTSGTGHIKFWNIASTFTGLKLQGYLGKFGGTELSDISSFVQFPDGKVLSSSESGRMILWDGGMIKCEISVKGKKPCHEGKIECISQLDMEIYTAGEDGYIRLWDIETIDTADVSTSYSSNSVGSSSTRIFEMDPVDEIFVGKGVKVCYVTFTQN